ncbi:TonB-dependent siderophore receptor [Roseomonas sp. WA12]
MSARRLPPAGARSRARRRLGLASLGALGVVALQLPAAEAQAQEAAVQVPEVSVTAGHQRSTDPVSGFVAEVAGTGTKTDTPILETPQSVSVVTRDDFEARAAQNLNQVLRYTAGVAADQRGATAVRLDQFTIRGFQPERYLDGLRLQGGRDANPSIDPYRLERVEVIRGPASVLYGQSTPGGLVNLVSKRPTDTPFREFLLQGGSYEQARIGFDMSGALDANREFLGRITGSYYTSDSQIDQVRERHYFIAPSLTWRPTSNTTLTILGAYQKDPESGSYGSNPVYGTLLPNPNGRIPRNFYDGDPNYERSNREQYSIGYALEHRFSDAFTFRQNARYLHTQGEYRSLYNTGIVSRDFTTTGRATIGTDVDVDAFTIDNQLVSRFNTGPLSHTVLAGFDLQRTLTDTYSYSGTGPSLNIFRPTYYLQNLPYAPFTSYSSGSQNQYGVYLQDQIRFGRLHLLLGGRHDWADTHSEATVLATRRTTTTDRNDTAFTGRAALLYQFDSGFSPYVSYSESFQPLNGTTAPQRGSTIFEPTTGRQYEIGFHYQPPGTKTLLSFAAFDLLQENLATRDPQYPLFSIQEGQVRSRGFEVEAKGELMTGLSFTTSYALLNPRRRNDNGLETVNLNIQGVPNGPTIPIDGKRPQGIPTQTATAWLDYAFQENTPARGLTLGGGVRYVGGTYADNANTLKVAGYTLLDAAIRYDLGQLTPNLQGLSAAVNFQNIEDKRYLTSCFGYSWCWYGNGRTVTGTLRYRF